MREQKLLENTEVTGVESEASAKRIMFWRIISLSPFTSPVATSAAVAELYPPANEMNGACDEIITHTLAAAVSQRTVSPYFAVFSFFAKYKLRLPQRMIFTWKPAPGCNYWCLKDDRVA